jgi:hypothetical protein
VPSFLYENPEHLTSLLHAAAQIEYGTLADIDGTYLKVGPVFVAHLPNTGSK